MSNLNTRNQEILGLLSLVGGGIDALGRKFGEEKVNPGQEEFKKNSDAARVSIRKYGIEKPSLTYVRMASLPKMFGKLKTDSSAISKEVMFRAERVNQPGVQILTSNVRRYGVGPIEKKPYSAGFNDVAVSFIGDARGVIHQFFYAWMNGVIGFVDMPDGAGGIDNFGKMPFEVEYRDEYKTTLEIVMYDEIKNQLGVVKLHNVYPIALGEIQRDWAGVNDLVRVNVNFTYSHWSYVSEILQIVEPTRETLASKNQSFLGTLMRGFSAMQAITSIKRPQNVNDILNVVNSGSTLLSSFLPNRGAFDY